MVEWSPKVGENGSTNDYNRSPTVQCPDQLIAELRMRHVYSCNDSQLAGCHQSEVQQRFSQAEQTDEQHALKQADMHAQSCSPSGQWSVVTGQQLTTEL